MQQSQIVYTCIYFLFNVTRFLWYYLQRKSDLYSILQYQILAKKYFVN
jgi:hypothetical protein